MGDQNSGQLISQVKRQETFDHLEALKQALDPEKMVGLSHQDLEKIQDALYRCFARVTEELYAQGKEMDTS